MRLTERVDMLAECFDRTTNTCAISSACRLRHALHEAMDAFYRALEQYTLENLALNPHEARFTLFISTPLKASTMSNKPLLIAALVAAAFAAPAALADTSAVGQRAGAGA